LKPRKMVWREELEAGKYWRDHIEEGVKKSI
jgi:hypothetical protein